MNNNITIEDILEGIQLKHITKVYEHFLLHGHYISYVKNNPCKHIKIYKYYATVRIIKNRFSIK